MIRFAPKPFPEQGRYLWNWIDTGAGYSVIISRIGEPADSWNKCDAVIAGEGADLLIDVIARTEREGRDPQRLLHLVWLARGRGMLHPDFPKELRPLLSSRLPSIVMQAEAHHVA